MTYHSRHASGAAGVAMDALQANAVTVQWGDVVAVKDVTLEVGPSTLLAVTGPSGAGKTSLLSALAGVVRPAHGQILIGGAELGGRDDAVHRGVVLIPQGNALAAVLTALENVAVPLLSRRSADGAAREIAMAALADVGVDEAADQLIDELSGGQQQRVAVARGLAERGRVVLADEPTSELDAGNRTTVMTLLRAEADRGAIVVVATHDPEAAALCDAELRLDEGAPMWVRDDR
jgi:putative ABC transport system ATP-binding protein